MRLIRPWLIGHLLQCVVTGDGAVGKVSNFFLLRIASITLM